MEGDKFTEVYELYNNDVVNQNMINDKITTTKEEIFENIYNLNSNKERVFYFVKLNEGVGVNGFYGSLGLHLKSIILTPKDKEGSLKMMGEIEENDSFSHWSGHHKKLEILHELESGKFILPSYLGVNKSIELYYILEKSLINGEWGIELNRGIEDILIEKENYEKTKITYSFIDGKEYIPDTISESQIIKYAPIITEYVYMNYRELEPEILVSNILILFKKIKKDGNLDNFNTDSMSS